MLGEDACAEPGALCVVTNAHETFCGRACSGEDTCPAGFDCMEVKKKPSGSVGQCVPTDFSCYY